MTISVTSDAAYVPPRNAVLVSVPAGGVMSTVAVWRNLNGVRTDLRVQPNAGFDTRTVYDYECPYGETVTYGWSTEYTDPTAYGTLYSTAWPDLVGWTTSSGTANVSGGKLRNTSISPTDAIVYRDYTTGRYRYTLASMELVTALTDGSEAAVLYINNGAGGASVSSQLTILLRNNGYLQIACQNGSDFYSTTTSGISLASPITIDFNESSITVTGTGGTVTIPGSFEANRIQFQMTAVAANVARFGALAIKTYSAVVALTETSSTTSITPDDGWLIHPGTPSLSFPLAQSGAAGIRSIGAISNESNATVHNILGSRTPVTTTNGDRASDETVMTIAIETRAEEQALTALLRDETPILINLPPALEVDFDYAFYQVGRTSRSRLEQMPGMQLRDYVLPLIEVQSPIVSQENTGWSYAALLVDYVTYAVLPMAYTTYADMTADNRNSGY